MVSIIHGKKIIMAIRTAMIFGTNVKVISLIDVIVWNMLIKIPTMRPTPSIGADTIRVTIMASLAKVTVNSGVTLILLNKY